jgi:hypothetical protein
MNNRGNYMLVLGEKSVSLFIRQDRLALGIRSGIME